MKGGSTLICRWRDRGEGPRMGHGVQRGHTYCGSPWSVGGPGAQHPTGAGSAAPGRGGRLAASSSFPWVDTGDGLGAVCASGRMCNVRKPCLSGCAGVQI